MRRKSVTVKVNYGRAMTGLVEKQRHKSRGKKLDVLDKMQVFGSRK